MIMYPIYFRSLYAYPPFHIDMRCAIPLSGRLIPTAVRLCAGLPAMHVFSTIVVQCLLFKLFLYLYSFSFFSFDL